MKSRRVPRSLATVVALAISAASSAFALNLDGQKYLPEAKISLTEARKIALKEYPGEFVSQEIEKEPGGSGLRYSFVIRNKDAKHEVGVDAKTGALLENSIEGSHPD